MATSRTRPRWHSICLLTASAVVACGDGASTAPGGPSDAYYVDCGATAPGEGTIDAPWNELGSVNAIALEPGDRILLRRGTTCVGMLRPSGSGTAEAPIVIGAYGQGPLPHIDANGAHTAAVHLNDMSHVVLRDLELTNPGNLSEPHRGVYLTATETLVSNVEIRDLYVHDVTGLDRFSGTAKSGGGIIGRILGDPPIKIDDVLIENNRIEDVGRSGIFFTASTIRNRPTAAEAWPDGGHGIVIRANQLTRLQGDAIVTLGTYGAVIEDNRVHIGNLGGRDWLSEDRNCAAGIWTWRANNTLIQRNEVSGYRFGQSATDGCDGTGFDVDNQQDGTIIQYNYSHDNEGGFILLCSDDERHGAEIRFNLSVDDGKVINASPCKFPTIGTFDDIRMYNNTFVTAHPLTGQETIPLEVLGNAGSFQFANNIVYATSPSTTRIACGDHCSNNLFYDMPPRGTDFVVDDPRFANPSWRGSGRDEAGEAFRIQPDSPAIGAGRALDGAPPTDYLGNDVPATPAIGMHQPG